MATPLTAQLLDETLLALPGWQGDESSIWREIRLPESLDEELRRQVDVDSHAMGNVPEIERVPGGTRFSLGAERGVNELDVALAAHISDLAHRLQPTEPGIDAVRDGDVETVDGTEDAEPSGPKAAAVPRDIRF